MKTKKYTLSVMIIALILVFGATTVFATTVSAHNGRHFGEMTNLNLCNVAECNTAGVHQHSGKYYSGHSAGDGHDYHTVCNVEGCSTAGVHQHNGEHYFGHSVNDGHDYHAVCNVEGCTEVTKHEHQSATSNRGSGHHNSSHCRGGHHY